MFVISSCKSSIRIISSTRPYSSRFRSLGKGLAYFLLHHSPKDLASFLSSILEIFLYSIT
ncbi:uncharacterized protein N7498_003053 [Penicillium cinerascens]|uniref:Uncharacterized protein n=1 Tax=Penicillium cinerascens TaxID=70096 RepID=A0A9W9NB88_9EURO|nr:uncharacterized protein N7498_003053 [Penicillium cinerascens]KAJ5216646.1 hypothetical protein N7498_003053 [Penicillium cinerascens]